MKGILLSILVIGVLALSACGTPAPVSEPEIPAHYTTYTDEAKVFSVSYPPEWEDLSPILFERGGDLEKTRKEAISRLESGLPVEKYSQIFDAGDGLQALFPMHYVIICVEPMPAGTSTHDQVVEAVQVNKNMQDYREFSRVKTTVGGREATIIESEGTLRSYPGLDKVHYLRMITLAGKTVWVVSCYSISGDFAEWANDAGAVVRSLRILK